MGLALAFSLRLERRILTLRALTAWRALRLAGGTAARSKLARLPRGAIPVCAVIRDEASRLPRFFAHHRAFGADLFLIIDNGSVDGGRDWALAQPDAVLWDASGSYRAARFGMDWVNAVLGRHARGHWALTLDADELLVYPGHDTRPLRALTDWLDSRGQRSLGAQMIDLHPPAGATRAEIDDALFDPGNTVVERDPRYANLWIRGGPRLRSLFRDRPLFAPALNKIPLIRWQGGDAYVSSTHAALPRGLNRTYARDRGERLSAAILHTKFIDDRPPAPALQAEHYAGGREFAAVRAAHAGGDSFAHPHSARYQGWRQLEDLGLMGRGLWA
jgi:hypothetical protein